MAQANSLTLQLVQDLADVKAHVTQNMVTKAHLAETLSQYNFANMATKEDLADIKAWMLKILLTTVLAGMGIAASIATLIARFVGN